MDFDTIFEINDLSEEEFEIVIRCQYSEIMNRNCKDKNKRFCPCNHIVKPNSNLCAYHLDCLNCGNPTDNKNSTLCYICKCDGPGCNTKKSDSSNYCNAHPCIKCKKFRHRYWNNLCDDCKCFKIDCKDPKIKGGNTCIDHSCNFCDTYMATPDSKKNPVNEETGCPNSICKCIVFGCNNNLINKFCCERHKCDFCDDLYNTADVKDITMDSCYRSTVVHVSNKKSNVSIDLLNGIKCKNQPIKDCLAKKLGYKKSDNCKDILAESCINELCCDCRRINKCVVCRDSMIDIAYLKYEVCSNCIFEYNCLNCKKECMKPKNKYLIELCKDCDKIVNSCIECRNVSEIGSIEFPPLDIYDKSLICANCLATNNSGYSNYYNGNYIQNKAAMISWKLQIADFNSYIQRIYERKNNKIKLELIYELVIHLLDEIRTPDTFYKTLKLLTRSEIASNNIVMGNLPNNYNKEYNLIGLFIRCANLPNELFWKIVKTIANNNIRLL